MQGANAGKLGVTLDLAHPDARPVIESLVRWADVVTESFAPGVVERIGLDYESLRAIEARPDHDLELSDGTDRARSESFAGFGNLAASVTGFQLFAGWPDRAPSGPAGAYTDYIAARYNAIAILAALEHRRRTGEGQYIDQSQAEAAFHFLTPELLDFSLNGRTRTRVGNDDLEMFPHGVFPRARRGPLGGDRGARRSRLARAVRSDRPRRLARRRGARERGRAARTRAAIDAAISAWTATRDARRDRGRAPGARRPRARGARHARAATPTRSSRRAVTSSTCRTRSTARPRSRPRARASRTRRRGSPSARSRSAATTATCSASCSASRDEAIAALEAKGVLA